MQECLFTQALVAAERQEAQLKGLLSDVQLKFDCAEKHRKSAQKQLEAQEEDLENLGQSLKVSLPSPLFHLHC